jgi:prepilin-type N-terminal cleavage/methylation domain-containing protein
MNRISRGLNQETIWRSELTPSNQEGYFSAQPIYFSRRDMKQRGFSLIELILAIGIFAFAAVSIFALMSRAMQTSRESRLESVAALLSGRVTSQLRASLAWSSPTSISDYTGGSTLAQIASGSPVRRINYYDMDLEPTDATSPHRQFALVTEVGPVVPGQLHSPNAEVASTLSHLPTSANTVFLSIEVSFPALAPEANRSKRHFFSIITRTSTN